MKKKNMIKPWRDELEKFIGEFCDQFLDREYKEVCLRVIDKMSRKREVPYLKGKISIWAAGIIHAIGRMNFLYDKKTTPYVSLDQLCNYFDTSKRTVGPKAKMILEMFKMEYFHPEFTTDSILEKSPFKDLVMVNGLIVHKDQVGMLFGDGN